MIRHFWALPAFLRLGLAGQHTFSIHDDLLAFPQYEVIFSESFVSEEHASLRLAHAAAKSQTAYQGHIPDSSSGSELSQHYQADPGIPGFEDDEQSPLDELQETYERVVLEGMPYLCTIPIVAPPAPENHTMSREEEENELMRATDRGLEALKGMQGNCVYFMSGWWSYQYCYDEGVKQFHQLPPSRGVPVYPPQEDPSVQSFTLGRLGGSPPRKQVSDDEEPKAQSEGVGEIAKLETKGETRYLVQRLAGGTTCDLTGRERKIEVQFHCNPQSSDRIALIKEVSTCSYLMVIDTPRLCNDVAFSPPAKNKPNAITCQEIVAEADIPAWESARASLASAMLSPQPPLADAAPNPTIGGTEVGAKKDVGGPGKEIQKSVIVGGGTETYVDTLASSDGGHMSDEEIKKALGAVRPQDLDKIKQQIERVAGGKGWKLDIVDTPRGREFRGVIDADKEDGEEVGEAGEGEGEGEGESEGEGSEETYREEL